MGIFGSLFGSSSADSDDVGGRCMDCGMAGGTHTEWCPTAEEARTDEPSAAPSGAELSGGDQSGEGQQEEQGGTA